MSATDAARPGLADEGSTGRGHLPEGAGVGARGRRGGRNVVRVLVASFVVTAAFAILLLLGFWQLQRLSWKTDLIATANAGLAAVPVDLPAEADWRAWDFRKVRTSGTYRHQDSIAFGFAVEDGAMGAHLLTPLVVENGPTFLVDRGWLPDALLPPATSDGLEPAGTVEVEGVLRWRGEARPGWFTPASSPEKRRVFELDWRELEGLTGLRLAPVVLHLGRSDGSDGLPRAEPIKVDYRNNHLGYAVTWFGLAAGLVVVAIVASRRRSVV